jgi:hypothetical protein
MEKEEHRETRRIQYWPEEEEQRERREGKMERRGQEEKTLSSIEDKSLVPRSKTLVPLSSMSIEKRESRHH